MREKACGCISCIAFPHSSSQRLGPPCQHPSSCLSFACSWLTYSPHSSGGSLQSGADHGVPTLLGRGCMSGKRVHYTGPLHQPVLRRWNSYWRPYYQQNPHAATRFGAELASHDGCMRIDQLLAPSCRPSGGSTTHSQGSVTCKIAHNPYCHLTPPSPPCPHCPQ